MEANHFFWNYLMSEHSKIMKGFKLPAESVKTAKDHSMGNVCLLSFSTSNYDTMKKFLLDFGFNVDESRNQLTPCFESGRAAYVRRGDFEFNLEESASANRRADFNLLLFDYSSEEIERIKSLGYKCEHSIGFGEYYTFQTPDGGTFVISD